MIIKSGVSNPDVYFNLDGLDYPRGQWTLIFNDVNINSDGTLNEPKINVGVRSKYDMEYVLVQPQPISSWKDGAGVRYSDLDILLVDLNTHIDFSGSSGGSTTPTTYNVLYDPPIIPSGTYDEVFLTATGVTLGTSYIISQVINISAFTGVYISVKEVSSDDTLRVVIHNQSGADVNLPELQFLISEI